MNVKLNIYSIFIFAKLFFARSFLFVFATVLDNSCDKDKTCIHYSYSMLSSNNKLLKKE